MYQNIPTNVINYIDSEGNIVTNAVIKSIQVRSEDDIDNDVIKNPTPGTRAYLPDESKVWIFGADEVWHLQATAENGGGGEEDPSERALFIHRVDYDFNAYLDVSWNTIFQAMWEGKVVYLLPPEDYPDGGIHMVLDIGKFSSSTYYVMIGRRSDTTEETYKIVIDYYSCSNPNDHPFMSNGPM